MDPAGRAAWDIERAEQMGLARRLLGDPNRRGVTEQALRTLEVVLLAGDIYDDRDLGRMALLGEALWKGGCTDAALLEHCLRPGEHARGCWVLDSILGKS